MKYEAYLTLVKKLELSAQNSPGWYKFRAVILAAIGYSYFFLIAGLPILVGIGLIGLVVLKPGMLVMLLKLGKLLIVVAFFALGAIVSFWGVIKSLFTKPEKPVGAELLRSEFPKLFNDIEDISKAINSPMPRHILLSPDFNASAITIPNRALLGNTTYMMLGLPLMQSLSRDQMRGVIAHEMGHFSRKHGVGIAWIYRLREAWARFLEAQQRNGVNSSFLYRGFLNWYFPYFEAYSFVLAREQEKEADRMAALITGKNHLAEALINLNLKGGYVEEKFWRSIFDTAKTEAAPPQSVFKKMVSQLRVAEVNQEALPFLQKSLNRRTDYSDTHPCLKERLELLGYKIDPNVPEVPPIPQSNAADYYIGTSVNRFLDKFDAEWRESVTPLWGDHHKATSENSARQDELAGKLSSEGLNDDELFELASIFANQDRLDEASAHLGQLLNRNPLHLDAKILLGLIYLDQDRDEGISILEDASRQDGTVAGNLYNRIYSYLHQKGRDEEAMKYVRKIDEVEVQYEAAQQERSTVTDNDILEPHDMSAEIITDIISRINHHEEILTAYLVKKKLNNFADHPMYVLGLDVKKKWVTINGENHDALLELVANSVGECGVHYVVVNSQFKNLKKQMQAINNSVIYMKQ